MFPLALTVLAELSSENREADLCLLDVSACDLDKDVPGIERDFCSLRVDNRWQGKHFAILIIEDWVLVKWLKNRQKLLHLDIVAEDVKESVGIHGLRLLQSLENYLIGR